MKSNKIKTEKWLRSWLKIKSEAFAKRTQYEEMTIGALIVNLDEIYKQALGYLKEVNEGTVRKLKKNRSELKRKVSKGRNIKNKT